MPGASENNLDEIATSMAYDSLRGRMMYQAASTAAATTLHQSAPPPRAQGPVLQDLNTLDSYVLYSVHKVISNLNCKPLSTDTLPAKKSLVTFWQKREQALQACNPNLPNQLTGSHFE